MRLLDLFCGAGGAAMGYSRAGFDQIVGIDIVDQPRYPFEFIQDDALTWAVQVFIEDGPWDLVHASPPCQGYSKALKHQASPQPMLVELVRAMLQSSGVPWIVENVPGAPLNNYVQMCGSGLGIERLRRHRWFEASFPLQGVRCAHSINHDILSVAGHGEGGSHRGGTKRGAYWGTEAKREAMGIDWMTRDELSQAIPPAYTEYLGRQFLDQLAQAS